MFSGDPPTLILTPSGRDAEVASAILAEERIPTRVCGTLAEVVSRLDTACCAVLSEEALLSSNRQELADWIARQPTWSDFPFILLTLRGGEPNVPLSELLGNVSLLERPFHPATLVMAVRFAYRARRRQVETRAHLAERERTAERQELLIRELNHRVKNTLATVQGLLGASARSATSVETFYASFSERIVSLGRTHNLLTEDYWQQALLHDILVKELGHYDDAEGTRIRLGGPEIALPGDMALPVGMAVHELTTNAAKHGALSAPNGRIQVEWDVTETSGARLLNLNWREEDGPPTRPPAREGFGSRLLKRVLTGQCNAQIVFDFRPTGLRFRMEAPLPQTRSAPI